MFMDLNDESDVILILFDSVLVFVHSFIFIAFKVVYNELKLETENVKTVDEYEYGKAINMQVSWLN